MAGHTCTLALYALLYLTLPSIYLPLCLSAYALFFFSHCTAPAATSPAPLLPHYRLRRSPNITVPPNRLPRHLPPTTTNITLSIPPAYAGRTERWADVRLWQRRLNTVGLNLDARVE